MPKTIVIPDEALSDPYVQRTLEHIDRALSRFNSASEQPSGGPTPSVTQPAPQTPRTVEPADQVAVLDGPGPFGPCPRNGCPGVVKRWYHKDGTSNHLACSERRYKDKNSCDFAAWDEDEQRAYFARLTSPPSDGGGTASEAVASSTEERLVEPPSTFTLEPAVLANRIHEALRKATPAKRVKVLKPFGWDGKSSYVLYVNGMASSGDERLVSLADSLGVG